MANAKAALLILFVLAWVMGGLTLTYLVVRDCGWLGFVRGAAIFWYFGKC